MAAWVRRACRGRWQQSTPAAVCDRRPARRPASKPVAAAASGCNRRRPPLALLSPTPQRPPKRLRQLECTSGRGLLLGSGSKGSPPAAHYISIAARLSGGGGGATPSAHAATDAADASTGWRLVYRSEVVSCCTMPLQSC